MRETPSMVLRAAIRVGFPQSLIGAKYLDVTLNLTNANEARPAQGL
jgi:hypothetical protein